MTDACGWYRAWLAEHGVEGAPPAMELHLSECDGCRTIAARYRGAVDVFRAATEQAAPVGGFDAVCRAARERRGARGGRWLGVAVAACAVAAVTVGVLRSPDQATPPDDARLVAAKLAGSARVSAPGGGVLREADEVSAGAIVETFEGEVTLADPLTATLSVAPGSRLRVAEWERSAAVVSLDRGRVRAQVEERSVGQRFEVVTEEATVRVVGTDFTVERAAGAGTLVTTLSGVVAVEAPGGGLLATVRAGQSFRVGAREALLREDPARPEPEVARAESAWRVAERETPRARQAEVVPAPSAGGPDVPGRDGRQADAVPEDTVVAPPVERSTAPPDPGTAVAPVVPLPAVADARASEARPALPHEPTVVAARVEPARTEPPGIARAARPALPEPAVEPRGEPDEPTVAEPAPGEPTVAEPAPDAPIVAEPAPDEPIVAEPAPDEPRPGAEPSPDEPIVAEPAPDEPIVAEPAPDEPIVAEPAPDEPRPGAEPSPDAILERARRLLAQGPGGDEEAVSVLERAVRTPSPMRGRLLALLGDAYRVAGRPEDAKRAYERALVDESGCPRGVVSDLATLLETDLGRAADARAVWERALEREPKGPLAARAHAELAALLLAADPGAADAHQRALAEGFPGASEAARAFVEVGRRLLDAGRWDDAAAWFEPALGDRSSKRAEAALVGLMRARIAQSRLGDARDLAARYSARFPSGDRRDEVERMVEALDEAK